MKYYTDMTSEEHMYIPYRNSNRVYICFLVINLLNRVYEACVFKCTVVLLRGHYPRCITYILLHVFKIKT